MAVLLDPSAFHVNVQTKIYSLKSDQNTSLYLVFATTAKFRSGFNEIVRF